MKGTIHLGLAAGLFHPNHQPKPRPMRPDQLCLLRTYEPELAESLARVLARC